MELEAVDLPEDAQTAQHNAITLFTDVRPSAPARAPRTLDARNRRPPTLIPRRVGLGRSSTRPRCPCSFRSSASTSPPAALAFLPRSPVFLSAPVAHSHLGARCGSVLLNDESILDNGEGVLDFAVEPPSAVRRKPPAARPSQLRRGPPLNVTAPQSAVSREEDISFGPSTRVPVFAARHS